MEGLFLIMEVNKSFSDLRHDFFALFLVQLSHEVAQITVWTVLEDNDEVLFLFEEEELPGLQNVRMLECDVHFSFSFGFGLVLLGDRDDFECVVVLVDGFGEINFSEFSFSEKFEESVVVDLFEHLFVCAEFTKKIRLIVKQLIKY